jgi:asparagine synthase (glutamine-hydrolysing)
MLKASIKLNYSYGYKWFEKGNLKVKGWVIDDSGKSYQNESLIDYFSNINSVENLTGLLTKTTGHFAVIISISDSLIALADRGRSIPLYFRNDRGCAEISDSGFSLVDSKNLGSEYDSYSFQEYLAAGHVTQNKTLLKNVSQLGAGEIAIFTEDKVDVISYFHFLPNTYEVDTFENFSNRFIEILDNSYKSLINSLNGRTVVIPLSGGYDSRSIASMFKRHGYQNVICYSFGQTGSPEMVTSQKVAEKLGYRWMFIETTPDDVHGFPKSDEFLRYVDYAANASSFYIIQDFFAVKKMRQEGLIPDDSVFMPGHSGDTLGGSNFLELFSGDESKDEMIRKLIDYRYDLNKVTDEFLESIEKKLNKQYSDSYKPALWFDYWCMKEWNPKMFANGVRVYEFFGYSYWLPLWGKDLLNFFANLPLEFRISKNLYEFTLEKKIYNPLGVNFSPERRLLYSHKTSIFQRFKNIVKKILPKSYIYRKFGYDPINSKLYTLEMYNDMKSKGVEMCYNGTNSVKSEWYIRFLEIKGSVK